MPPMMGVGAFLMAQFLGVPYWDVVLRGFALAFVYYVSVGIAVYLLCVRLLPRDAVEAPKVPLYDKVKTSIFFSTVLFLLYLMGFVGTGELRAAVYTAGLMLALLIAAFFYFKYVLKDPEAAKETLFGNLRRAIETHAEMTSYLTLLLATLGIMIGLFTVTGFINRMGGMLLDLGSWNVIAMILMAYIFGWLAGAGLPPTATYIIGAVVIVRPLQELGINPWIAHFFVFLLSVWGELSPPTSLTAAVSARIANASFLRTMWEALKICLPITLMTFAIFTRPNMVVNPGWWQIADTTAGADLDLRHHLRNVRALSSRTGPPTLRCAACWQPYHSSACSIRTCMTSAIAAVVVVPAFAVGVWRHRQIAAPKTPAATASKARPRLRPICRSSWSRPGGISASKRRKNTGPAGEPFGRSCV